MFNISDSNENTFSDKISELATSICAEINTNPFQTAIWSKIPDIAFDFLRCYSCIGEDLSVKYIYDYEARKGFFGGIHNELLIDLYIREICKNNSMDELNACIEKYCLGEYGYNSSDYKTINNKKGLFNKFFEKFPYTDLISILYSSQVLFNNDSQKLCGINSSFSELITSFMFSFAKTRNAQSKEVECIFATNFLKAIDEMLLHVQPNQNALFINYYIERLFGIDSLQEILDNILSIFQRDGISENHYNDTDVKIERNMICLIYPYFSQRKSAIKEIKSQITAASCNNLALNNSNTYQSPFILYADLMITEFIIFIYEKIFEILKRKLTEVKVNEFLSSYTQNCMKEINYQPALKYYHDFNMKPIVEKHMVVNEYPNLAKTLFLKIPDKYKNIHNIISSQMYLGIMGCPYPPAKDLRTLKKKCSSIYKYYKNNSSKDFKDTIYALKE